ncbi:MAG: TetR/AcrR family transcriptional regulator [Ruminococcus sp.]|nr:TetR/AcrR family transcriptional regulator [Ruminococcus sp.]
MKKQPEVTAATRQGFIDAFWTLYKEKGIEKISVSEITKISGNNRSTFYHYFLDVYDLLEQIEDKLLEDVNRDLKSAFGCVADEISSSDDFNILFSRITPVFRKYEEKLFVLIGSHGDPKFSGLLRKHMKENLLAFQVLPNDTEHIDYIINFIYSSIIGMLGFWYEREHDISEEEFIKLVPNLTAYGVLGYRKGVNS